MRTRLPIPFTMTDLILGVLPQAHRVPQCLTALPPFSALSSVCVDASNTDDTILIIVTLADATVPAIYNTSFAAVDPYNTGETSVNALSRVLSTSSLPAATIDKASTSASNMSAQGLTSASRSSTSLAVVHECPSSSFLSLWHSLH